MAVGEGGEGSFAALKRLLATAVAIGKTRFELLSVELQEEKLRLLGMLVYAGAALFFLGVGIILLVFFLAVAFWEQRLVVTGGDEAVREQAAVFLCARDDGGCFLVPRPAGVPGS